MAEKRRPPIVGRYTKEELGLASRNSGMPLEALRYDVTPAGLHYLLIHFDIPDADVESWRLEIGGLVERPRSLGLAELRQLPARTLRVTLECAGNGRAQMAPRYPSMPWLEEGVSTAEWTGTPLRGVLETAGLKSSAKDVVFHGADRGMDRGIEHAYARSLVPQEALHEDVLLVYAMNGAPLLPQHGAPLRLIVPRWYGMASVKWLARIEAIDRAFDGVQQALSYHFRAVAGEKGTPCTHMRVNSLMSPPGIPDFYARRRLLRPGRVQVRGRAWSGSGRVRQVEFSTGESWCEARLEPAPAGYAWQGWSIDWDAAPGVHRLRCRATDDTGSRQPLEPIWDATGFGNNAVQAVEVTVQ